MSDEEKMVADFEQFVERAAEAEAEIKDLREQRDELLEALEMMLEMSEMSGFGKAAAEDVARAAIAKAKGE